MADYQVAGNYETRFLNVDGVKTRLAEAGVGNDETVVLVHSGEFGASLDASWELTIDELAEEYHVVAPDIIGYGYTDKVFDFIDQFDFRVEHLRKLVRLLYIDEAHFVGHSMGAGYIASMAAEDEDVWGMNKLVLAHGGGGPPQGFGDILKEFDGSKEAVEDVLDVMYYDEWWDGEEYVEWRQELSRVPGHWQCTAAIRFEPPFEEDRTFRRSHEYENIDNETLIVGGKQDPLKPAETMEELADQIGDNARLELFDKSYHGAPVEHPDRFNELVLDFLSE